MGVLVLPFACMSTCLYGEEKGIRGEDWKGVGPAQQAGLDRSAVFFFLSFFFVTTLRREEKG